MLQLRSDVAICYGDRVESLAERIAQWKDQGYIAHLMTGVSWGQYQDYLYGRFDGVKHVDEAQTDRLGKVISHGGDVYYMSPGENYGKFLCQGVKRAMDAGAMAIHLEEPEFWVRGGYSEGFKREWKAHYHEDWIPPHSSPDAQYRASQLKYYLYRRALKQVFDFVKAENAQDRPAGQVLRADAQPDQLRPLADRQPRVELDRGRRRRLHRPGLDRDCAHAQRLRGRPARADLRDRVPRIRRDDERRARRAAGHVWFLNDPIEDNPDHSWDDYATNWESTLTASLLWPQVWRYEVMPWPERIFHGKYPTVDSAKRKRGEAVVREADPAGLRHRVDDRHHRAQRHGPERDRLGLRHPRYRRASSPTR